jgi:NADPH:quinone reductase-like Zn-dependent oxidoreductase
VITQRSFGEPDVLQIVDAPAPEPLPTEVVVRVRAVGLNPIEAFIRSGAFPLLGQPPFVLGWDVSGVVEQAAPATWRFAPGDEVFGMPLFPRAAGGYAELLAAPARHLARKPPSLDHVQAAALPLVGLTAWQGLVDLADVGDGDRVLIHGGGGGVGHIAIQLAKLRGAHVITTASVAKRDFVTELGADEVIDYRRTDFTRAVEEVDVVLDPVGGDYGERSLTVLRPGGMLVTAVDRLNAELAAKAEAAGRRFAGIAVDPDPVGLSALAELAERGQLRVHVESAFPFARVADAHRLLEGGHVQGKLVLTVGRTDGGLI